VEQEFQEAPPAPGTVAVDRAADLLVRVLESEEPLALTDLAAAAELPKSTASRVVSALERHGLVSQDGTRGPLRPGPAILRYAHRGIVERSLVELSREPLDALAAASGETVNLAVPAAGAVEHIAQVDGVHFLGTGQWLDRRVDFHSTAVGKVFLAFGAAELPEGELRRLAPRTICDRDKLGRELARVRRAGWATAVDELEPGLAALAAPVRDRGGQTIAALSITGPTLRLPPPRLAELSAVAIREGRSMSRALGHHQEGDQVA
jgi:IclR family transcriptional regulator, acetate operon repressor